jgi:hypothetical protein
MKNSYNIELKLVFFIILVFVLFLIKSLLNFFVESIPEEIKIQIKRSDFINKKIINKVNDEANTFHLDIL